MNVTLSPRETAALEGLAQQWTGLYKLSHSCGVFTAIRWDDADPLTASTLPGLAAAVRRDFYRRVTR